MNNAFFRSLIIFGACIVLAMFLGFMLAGPLTYSSLLVFGLVGFVLAFPIFLRWHYPLMLLSWGMTIVVPFLPGRPSLVLPMIAMSLGISILQRTIAPRSQFITVPQIVLPLFFMLAVVAFTAKMNGFGLHAFGGSVYGGRKYIYLVAGILGYFALTARRIPPERINLYVGLFYLGGITAFVGDLLPFLPHSLYFIYYLFNADLYTLQPLGFTSEGTRFAGATAVATAILTYMIARYGVRGVFLSRKPMRLLLFLLFSVYGLFGGFRGFIVMILLLIAIQFCLEGLHRTRWMALAVASGITVALALIPLASHLPYTFQRAISILPYKVSMAARLDAEQSTDWRLNMWQAILPEIPRYLLLGKGYTIDPRDYDFVMGPEAAIHTTFAQNQGLALAEDFHNGPISVVIPFGIWGSLVFLWFIAAGIWVVYRNYRYGNPMLKSVNTFLFAAFLTHVIFFTLIYGDLSADMLTFCGFLGLSVAINGGVARRLVRVAQHARQTPEPARFARLRPAPVPAFPRQQPGTSR